MQFVSIRKIKWAIFHTSKIEPFSLILDWYHTDSKKIESEPQLDWLAALGVAPSPDVGLGSIHGLTWGVSSFLDLIPVAFITLLCHVR
jgi:hypothetical protein